MVYLILSEALFACVVSLHISWCRLVKHKDLSVKSYAVICLIILGIYIWFLKFSPSTLQFLGDNALSAANMPLQLSSIAYYLLLCWFYLIIYHMIIVDSPTRSLLDFLKMKEGSSREEMASFMKDGKFIKTRLDSLIDFCFVKKEGERYTLTAQGKRIGNSLKFYQFLLKDRQKGG